MGGSAVVVWMMEWLLVLLHHNFWKMDIHLGFRYTLIFELSCMSCCSGSTKSLI